MDLKKMTGSMSNHASFKDSATGESPIKSGGELYLPNLPTDEVFAYYDRDTCEEAVKKCAQFEKEALLAGRSWAYVKASESKTGVAIPPIVGKFILNGVPVGPLESRIQREGDREWNNMMFSFSSSESKTSTPEQKAIVRDTLIKTIEEFTEKRFPGGKCMLMIDNVHENDAGVSHVQFRWHKYPINLQAMTAGAATNQSVDFYTKKSQLEHFTDMLQKNVNALGFKNLGVITYDGTTEANRNEVDVLDNLVEKSVGQVDVKDMTKEQLKYYNDHMNRGVDLNNEAFKSANRGVDNIGRPLVRPEVIEYSGVEQDQPLAMVKAEPLAVPLEVPVSRDTRDIREDKLKLLPVDRVALVEYRDAASRDLGKAQREIDDLIVKSETMKKNIEASFIAEAAIVQKDDALSKLEGKELEVFDLTNTVEELSVAVKQSISEIEKLEKDKAAYETKNNELFGEVEELKSSIIEKDTEISEKDDEIVEKDALIETQENSLAEADEENSKLSKSLLTANAKVETLDLTVKTLDEDKNRLTDQIEMVSLLSTNLVHTNELLIDEKAEAERKAEEAISAEAKAKAELEKVNQAKTEIETKAKADLEKFNQAKAEAEQKAQAALVELNALKAQLEASNNEKQLLKSQLDSTTREAKFFENQVEKLGLQIDDVRQKANETVITMTADFTSKIKSLREELREEFKAEAQEIPHKDQVAIDNMEPSKFVEAMKKEFDDEKFKSKIVYPEDEQDTSAEAQRAILKDLGLDEEEKPEVKPKTPGKDRDID